MNSEGTDYLMAHAELWASEDDRAACQRDLALYGNSYSQRNADGLLAHVDPVVMHPSSDRPVLEHFSQRLA